MDLLTLIEFLGGAFIAEIIGTIGGFGSATLFTAFGTLFFNIKTVIGLVAFFHLTGAIVRGIYFFKSINWRVFSWFIITDIVFTVIGAFVIFAIPESSVNLIFGIFLSIYALLTIISPKSLMLPAKKIWLLVGGGVSGFLAGLLGTGGAARSAALQIFKLPKESYLGTSAAMAVVTDTLRIPIYLGTGLLVVNQYFGSLLVGLGIVSVLGALVGSKIATKIPEWEFRLIIHVILLFTGLYFIYLSF